jgi:ubiquinone/menaquinone biosynthesis C-methylase UbiE
MHPADPVRVFASNSAEYHGAFKTFLDHTDQKVKALEWLGGQVDRLPQRNVMIDAGAGTGKLTSQFVHRFQRVVAIEPNPSLLTELTASCPSAKVIPTNISDANPAEQADFILCSHVFYYIPQPEWHITLDRLIDWLAPGGVLAVAIQNPDTDCMRMLYHFVGSRGDLRDLQVAAESAARGRYQVRLETVRARIQTDNLETACQIAEFLLNVLPIPSPPLWSELQAYVTTHFQKGPGYEFSCDQDFLRIERHRKD